MMEEAKNKVGVVILIIIILVFVVGGYFLMDYMVNSSNDNKSISKEEEAKEFRIDTSKDYIYTVLGEEIIEDIYKEDLVLNIKGLESINESLQNELEELSKEQEIVDGQEIPEGITCENELYSFKYRGYTITAYGDYVSVVIVDYLYNCVNGSVPYAIKSYVINKSNGNIISDDELLSIFGKSNDDIINGVKSRLETTQVIDEENGSVIDVDGTINGVNNGTYQKDKALSVSRNGKLTFNFIVKSNKIDYNDSIELD